MPHKIIERRWKEGLIELVWAILSNNSMFSVEKFSMNKLLPLEFLIIMGGDVENNLLHLSGNYIDDKSISNIPYNNKSLGSLWDGFPIGGVA